MPTPSHSHFLRNLLSLDAATCAVMGAVLIVGAVPIGQSTAIPPTLLFWAGLALLPIAAFIAATAAWAIGWPAAVSIVVLGNVLWVAGSLWLLVAGWIAPNSLGYLFIAAQAAAVAVLTVLEYTASRRAFVTAG
jgi:hypothetical protein